MFVTATQFKNSVGKYLAFAAKEDIIITKNGRSIAKVSDFSTDKQSILDGLVGIAAANPVTLEEARAERLARQ